MMLIDAHTHLDRYEDKLDRALEEIEEHDIFTISTSMNVPSYHRNLKIAERTELVLPIFGVHPWNASGYADTLGDIREPVDRSPMLGEIGLDYHFVRKRSRYAAQRKVFEYFLAAARDQRKIVNIHTKGAEAEVLELLDRYRIERAIVHWYSGPIDILREMIARGLYFTVGVEVMTSPGIMRIAGEIPSDLLLTETDNPGGVKWLTGAAGMPRAIEGVVEKLSAIHKCTPEGIVEIVYRNLKRLVDADEWLPDACRHLFGDSYRRS